MQTLRQHSAHGSTNPAAPATTARPFWRLEEPGQPTLALQVQAPTAAPPHPRAHSVDVVYLHGSTFGADLSIFFSFDGRSWADALNDAGYTVWGFDWAGYGHSARYASDATTPVGRLADALPQLRRVVAAIRARNGDRPVAIVAHSWGASVAGAYAARYPKDVRALVLFAPVVPRTPTPMLIPTSTAPAANHYPVSLLTQYRRFVEDVPRGQPQVLDESHFHAWGKAYLATDPTAQTRSPASVWTPAGPGADVQAMWSGHWLFDPANVEAPTLLVRGEWDSLCTDTDATMLCSAWGSPHIADCKISRATHLMHLESQRGELYQRTNQFLHSALTPTTPTA